LEIYKICDDTFLTENAGTVDVVCSMSNINRLGVNENEFIKLSCFLWMVTKVRRVIKASLD